MMIRFLQKIPRRQLLVVHASLSDAERHGALEHTQRQAHTADIPLLVAKARKSLMEMVERGVYGPASPECQERRPGCRPYFTNSSNEPRTAAKETR